MHAKNLKNKTNKSSYSCQSEMYEEEKKRMFTYINNYITNLSIETERMTKSNLQKSVLENKVKTISEGMKSAQEVINQLKSLINLEKSRILLPTNDIMNDKNKCALLKDKISWMENLLDTAIVRYNEIGKSLKMPSNDLFIETKKQTTPFKLNFVSKKKREEIERQQCKESHLILIDLRTAIDVLKSRIVDHGITPTYRFLKRSTSGQQSNYNYSCTLFGMYGNGTSKYKAKENAAIEMLRYIIKKQKNLSLSSHIRPFNKKEFKTMSPLIKFKSNYVEILSNACVKNDFSPPIYTLLSQKKSENNLDDYYSIQCDAMNIVAIGHSNKRSTAEQMSAQNIINLWDKMNQKSNNSISP